MESYLDLRKYRKIFLRDYTIMVNIGVHDYEKTKPQKILINIDLYIELENTISKNDNINEIFNYDFIRKSIEEIIKDKHIELQETLCDKIMELMLGHNLVHAARVSTEKPDIYIDCKGVGVELFKIKY